MTAFIKRNLSGYTKISIEGRSTERFLNIASKRGIAIWDAEECECGISFFIYSYDAAKISEIAEKSGCHLKIVGKYGVWEFFRRHKVKSFFILGIALFIISLYTLSLFVWDIRIYVKNKEDADAIMKICAENGLKKGSLKSSADIRSIEAVLKREIKDLSWIRIEFKGTYADIKTAQAIPPNEEIFHEPCDIISSEDGIILSITAAEGTPLLKAGDVVKKGDVLISGKVQGIENETVVTEKYVHARGKISAKFWLEEKERIDFLHYIKEYTGNKKEIYKLDIFGNSIGTDIFGANIGFENYDTKKEKNKIHLRDDFVIPLEFEKAEYREYTLREERYSKKEAVYRGEVVLKSKLLAKYKKENIKDVKIFCAEDENGVTVSAVAVIEDEIGIERDI